MVKGIKKIWVRVENTGVEILDSVRDFAMVETYHLLIENGLTPLEIHKERKVNISAVYKSINKLKKRGLIKGWYKNNFLKGGECQVKLPSDNYIWRQHAIGFTLELLEKSSRYTNLLKNRTQDELDNNTIMLNDNNLVVYLVKDFFGNTPEEYERKSLNYISRFIVMLENNFAITLKKGRQSNLKEFRCEIEKLNDPLAKKRNIEKNRLVIYDLEDGTQRAITDKSFKGNNLELVKKGKARPDARRIDVLWNELLDSDISLIDLNNGAVENIHSVENLTNVVSDILKYAKVQQNERDEVMLMFKAQLKINENLYKQINKRL